MPTQRRDFNFIQQKENLANPNKLSGFSTFFDRAWRQYFQQLAKYSLFSFFVLLGIASSIIYAYTAPSLKTGLELWALILGLAIFFVFFYSWGYAGMTLAALYSEAPTIEILEFSLAHLISYIWIAILSALIITVGYFLFIIPGIIFTSWFLFAVFIFFENQTQTNAQSRIGGMAVLIKSREYARGKVLSIFVLFFELVFILSICYAVVNEVLALLAIPLLSTLWTLLFSLFSSPFIIIYNQQIYRELKSKSKFAKNLSLTTAPGKFGIIPSKPNANLKFWLYFLAILGLLIYLALVWSFVGNLAVS